MAGNDFLDSKVRRLPLEFYTRNDVLQIARELLGKVLVTEFDGRRCAGRITETEAYCAPEDRASHAFGNRRTARTEIMFQEGGRAYVYLCYGIHHLFNVVTGPEGAAHAVLIRAIEPLEGEELMFARRGKPMSSNHGARVKLSTGPGALSHSLGIHTVFTGQSLVKADASIWIEDWDENILASDIAAGPRIGVEYAAECAAWPWRFWVKNSPFVKK